jgi:hypothetical protein
MVWGFARISLQSDVSRHHLELCIAANLERHRHSMPDIFKFRNSLNSFAMLKPRTCISTSATPSLPLFLSLEIRRIHFIYVWLDVQNFGVLDMAVSSYSGRKLWLTMLKSISWKAIDAWQHSHSSMIWVCSDIP